MRIDLNQRIPGAHGSEDAKRTGSPSSARASATQASQSDAAQLSAGPGSVQTLEARVHQLPEVRAERVAALSAMIESGSYRVGAGQIAEALLAHMTQPSAG